MSQRWQLLIALARLSPHAARAYAAQELPQGQRQLALLVAIQQALAGFPQATLRPLLLEVANQHRRLERLINRYLTTAYGQGWPSQVQADATTTPQLSASQAVALLLDQEDPWLPLFALYALTALPPATFDQITQTEQVIRVLHTGQRSPHDAIREAARLIAVAQQYGPHLAQRSDFLLSRHLPQPPEDFATMLSTLERMLFLRNVSFFQQLRLDQLRTVARLCQEQPFVQDEMLLRQGALATAC
ncbi:MAG: hypothetical protein HC915_16800 [Anaerolineae bacterium]|nr:hypothetical protein [Anaerolineae bacterium]